MNAQRPWLSPTGVELQIEELRQISLAWSAQTWEAYLNWFEGGRREAVISTALYQSKLDELEESVFDSHGPSQRTDSRLLCEQLLATLPEIEALVLRRYFLEGRTFVEIAYELKRSRTGTRDIQLRAIARLKRENPGDGSSSRRYMRDVDSLEDENQSLVWDGVRENAQLEDSKPLQSDFASQFAQISDPALRSATLSLSKAKQQILFASFWQKKSLSQIASELRTGANVVAQLRSAAAFQFKKAVLNEIKNNQGGVS